jgi:multiple sugar transport system permease protein
MADTERRASERGAKWRAARRIAAYVPVIVLSVAFFLPFIWLVLTSLKPDADIMAPPPSRITQVLGWLIPHPVEGRNYADVMTSGGEAHFRFWRYLGNTLVISIMCLIGTVLSCSLVAYGLSRIHWRGRDVLFGIILATMMLPYQVVMVPLFVVFAKLGWVDTFKPLIVPSFLGNAFFIFLLRQFFLGLPRELTDAAKIDGASEFQIYSRIVLPLAKPALATVALFAFMAAWNDYLGPLIYLNDDSLYTLSIGLATLRGQYGTYWGLLMAASTVMTVPIIVLFFLAQRTFIQGIQLTGLKG